MKPVSPFLTFLLLSALVMLCIADSTMLRVSAVVQNHHAALYLSRVCHARTTWFSALLRLSGGQWYQLTRLQQTIMLFSLPLPWLCAGPAGVRPGHRAGVYRV